MQTQKSLTNYPKRGEIFIVDLNPGLGREIHKKRPCLVISGNVANTQSPHVVIIPVSSQIPKLIGMEMILVGKTEGLAKRSVVLPLYIRSIDQNRLVKKIGEISKNKLEEVEEALRLILDLY